MDLYKRLFLECFVLIICFSCNNSTSSNKNKWNGLEYRLEAEYLNSDIELLKVNDIVLTNRGDVIIKNASTEGLFSYFILSGDSLTYVDSFVQQGQGPYEVNDADINYLPEYNSLVLVGFNPRGKYIVVSLDNMDNISNYASWQIYQSKHDRSLIDEPRPVDTVSYVALNFEENSDNVFVSFGINDAHVKEIPIHFPENAKTLSSFDKFGDIYSVHHFVKRPNHNQFVYCFQKGYYAEIFELDDNHSVIYQNVVFDEYPTFTERNGKAFCDMTVPVGFRICVSEKHIYFSDPNIKLEEARDAQEKNGYLAGYVKNIYVSDWKGEPIVKYITDIPISKCRIDKDEKYIYASTYDQETFVEAIVRFALPDLEQYFHLI